MAGDNQLAEYSPGLANDRVMEAGPVQDERKFRVGCQQLLGLK
jgi:hypothetical protein